jgi:ABC-2 type transport system permease protein
MTDCGPVKRTLPTHFTQMLTVTRYEMLKYMRSRRLIGCIAVIILIVALIYIIPLAVNQPYSGHVTLELGMKPPSLQIPLSPFSSFGYLNHSYITSESIVVSINGTEIPRTNWTYNNLINAVVINQTVTDLAGKQVVADFDFKEPAKDFASSFVQFVSTLIIICIVFFGADALVSEYQTRTAYLLFPNPIKKEVMFLGKFLASFIASLSMVGLFYVLIVVLSLLSVGGVAFYLPLSFAFATLFLISILAVAFFISSIMKGSTGAIVLTFFLMFMILPIVQSVGMISGMKMWFLVTFTGDLASTSLNWDHYPVDSVENIPGMGFTLYSYYPDPGTSVCVMFAYLVIFGAISMYLFKRKELTG